MRVFVCKPINNARMTTRACGMRHRQSKKAGDRGKWKLHAPVCVRCVVGKAHAKKIEPSTWPDGSPIVRLRLKGANRCDDA